MLAAIVQLSDIHLTEANNLIYQRLPQIAAAICGNDSRCLEYVLALTGDVAWSGQEAEYSVARRIIRDLKERIVRHRPHARVTVITIPGNHDCFLPKEDVGLRDVLVQAIGASLQAAPDQSILDALLKQQTHYFTFANDFHPTLVTAIDLLCRVETVTIGDHRL